VLSDGYFSIKELEPKQKNQLLGTFHPGPVNLSQLSMPAASSLLKAADVSAGTMELKARS